MLSIQKLFGRDGKFYDLLEASAQQADTSVHHLVALLEKSTGYTIISVVPPSESDLVEGFGVGNAHIGVLRFLEREGFQIRAIAGSSFGGLVACFYAAGFNPDEIEQIFARVDQSRQRVGQHLHRVDRERRDDRLGRLGRFDWRLSRGRRCRGGAGRQRRASPFFLPGAAGTLR